MDTDGAGVDNGNTLTGNFIGTNAAGTALICTATYCGNINRGILIVGTTGHIIGNGTSAGRNIISGNFGTGISITGGGSGTISNNYIGTDRTGTMADHRCCARG